MIYGVRIKFRLYCKARVGAEVLLEGAACIKLQGGKIRFKRNRGL